MKNSKNDTFGFVDYEDWRERNERACDDYNKRVDNIYTDQNLPHIHPVEFNYNPSCRVRFMAKPYVVERGEQLLAKAQKMTRKKFEALLEGNCRHICLYRVYTTGDDRMYTVVMHRKGD